MPAGWDPLRFDCPDAIAGHGRPDPAAIYGAPGAFAMLRPAQPTAIDATLALGPDRARAALETLLAK